MKVFIEFDFKDGPWGGGNQFLKALRNYLDNNDLLAKDYKSSDVVITNSHHKLLMSAMNKRKYRNILLVHRIDGPVSMIRNSAGFVDKYIFSYIDEAVDAVVFQSSWSKNSNYKLGLKKQKNETIILNASDEKIFNNTNKVNFSKNRKIKLIASSWSGNPSKGFDTYEWLDKNLDFRKYELLFVGNSPKSFNHITMVPPCSSKELAELLRQCDIYITASKNDPCSNALIEALSCGLPAIAKKDGGHPEIIKNGGELFDDSSQIPKLLDKIESHYDQYVGSISVKTITQVSEEYYKYIVEVAQKCGKKSKKISIMGICKLAAIYSLYRLSEKYTWIINRIKNR